MSRIYSPEARWVIGKFHKTAKLCARERRKNLEAKASVHSVKNGQTNTLLDRFFSKSSAQVETLVSPQVVSPKSCELKLGRKRPYRLMGRFSKQERVVIKAKAKAASMSVNELIRASVLGSDYKSRSDPELTRALLALNRELTAQGNNINQIAKQLNSGKASPDDGEGMLGMIGRSLLKTHKAIRCALTRGEPQP